MADEDIFDDPEYVRLYDWSYRDYNDDMIFLMELAHRHGAPVLDVACGTGREAIRLARAGFEVVGFDRSEPALDAARRKLADEPEEVRQRVTLRQADMEDFDMGPEFGTVVVPNASVFHLPGKYSLTRFCRSLYRHTEPGGVAMLDCVSPAVMRDTAVGERRKIKEEVNPETGLLTREFEVKLSLDWAARVARVEHRFVEGEDDQKHEHVFRQSYRWISRDEGVEALRQAGFPEIETLGDYDLNPYTDDSPRLIFLAHRLEREFV
jgi:SAM-dependent methyltransferase